MKTYCRKRLSVFQLGGDFLTLGVLSVVIPCLRYRVYSERVIFVSPFAATPFQSPPNRRWKEVSSGPTVGQTTDPTVVFFGIFSTTGHDPSKMLTTEPVRPLRCRSRCPRIIPHLMCRWNCLLELGTNRSSSSSRLVTGDGLQTRWWLPWAEGPLQRHYGRLLQRPTRLPRAFSIEGVLEQWKLALLLLRRFVVKGTMNKKKLFNVSPCATSFVLAVS